MKPRALILAAGKGTRMRSSLPKVLHPLAGLPMLERVIDCAVTTTGADPVVVYGHGGQRLLDALAHRSVQWVEQAQQLGTGHAVQVAMKAIEGDPRILVLYGDVPLTTPETLARFLAETPEDAVGILTARMTDPTGYGRIIRDNAGTVTRIVEQKDANDAERLVDEINTGIMLLPGAPLRGWLASLSNENAQGEYYLTDVVAAANAAGVAVHATVVDDLSEVAGVNDRVQLATLEREYQRRAADALMRAGVTIADPARIDIRGTVTAEEDVVLDVGVVLEGNVSLGRGSRIGPHCVLRDCTVGADTEVLEFSSITEATVGKEARVGPFARVRPGAVLGDRSHVGNFVELKKAVLGEGSKVNHLSYVGDADVGRNVNIGAGTITCNYDGANKFKTTIGDDVFVGSDTQLIAPVTVGAGATIGAGATVTDDIPAGALAISRVRQRHIPNWKRPEKKKS